MWNGNQWIIRSPALFNTIATNEIFWLYYLEQLVILHSSNLNTYRHNFSFFATLFQQTCRVARGGFSHFETLHEHGAKAIIYSHQFEDPEKMPMVPPTDSCRSWYLHVHPPHPPWVISETRFLLRGPFDRQNFRTEAHRDSFSRANSHPF